VSTLIALEKKKFPALRKRTIPKAWEDWMSEYSPPTDRFKWLKIIHEQGYPWEPIDRFIIYEMLPVKVMDTGEGLLPEILAQLQHPQPPSEMGNYYDHALGEFVRNEDCLITERAWHLYRETGAWGRPYWVIQGTKGGHKRWFSQIEQQLLRAAGLPHQPPEPGDLPFAEFDDRVKKQLHNQDMLRSVHVRLKGTKQQMVAVNALRQERMERELRENLVKFLYSQVADIAGDVHKSLVELDAPRSDFDVKEMERLGEEVEQAYIETGRTDGLIRIAR
jgi:hypothetical protein